MWTLLVDFIVIDVYNLLQYSHNATTEQKETAGQEEAEVSGQQETSGQEEAKLWVLGITSGGWEHVAAGACTLCWDGCNDLSAVEKIVFYEIPMEIIISGILENQNLYRSKCIQKGIRYRISK